MEDEYAVIEMFDSEWPYFLLDEEDGKLLTFNNIEEAHKFISKECQDGIIMNLTKREIVKDV